MFVVDNEAKILTYYQNGDVKARNGEPYAIDAAIGSLPTDYIELFGDEDNENGQGNDLRCASVAIFDYALTKEQVASLGNIRVAVNFNEN